MATTGFSHVAIGVTDMARARGFYRDVIGLNVQLDQWLHAEVLA